MSALAIEPPVAAADYERQTHIVEGRLYVTSGSRVCPMPSLCDWKDGETYDGYVRRHCVNHQLGSFEELEDAERNLGVWCGFYYARYVQGNESLGTKFSAGCATRGCEKRDKSCFYDHKIVAHGEPCWEDAEYLFNDSFTSADLEFDVPWESKRFTLFAVDDREPYPLYKRFKKYVKTRGTQKTSWGKAKVTFELLHAYFVQNNPFFRILTISKASTTARLQYFIPLKQLWSRNSNIKRLYGVWETRCKRCGRIFQTVDKPTLCPDENCMDLMMRGDQRERRHILTQMEQPQRIGLVTRGSFGRDVITARWIVNAEESSAMTITTLMCAGIDSTIVGSRWDLIVFDDPHDRNNIATPVLRNKVKDLHVELRKQLDALGRLVWLCTPWHDDDASAEIDKEYASEFHIMYRPAMWDDNESSTPLPVYYWQYDAMARPVWNAQRIKDEENKIDFSSQVLLRPSDPRNAIYTKDDFPVIHPDNAPIEIRFGLGRDLTETEREILRAEGVEIYAYNFVDSAGKTEQTDNGCDTADAGVRFDRYGDVYVTYVSSGQWTVTEELNDVWAGYVYNRPDSIDFELSAAHKKYVEPAFREFTAKKSKELKQPLSLPMNFVNVSHSDGQERRIEAMHPHIKAGRVKFLETVPKEQRDKAIGQFVRYRTGKRDIADAISRSMKYLTPSDRTDDDEVLPEISPETPCAQIMHPRPGGKGDPRPCGIAFEYHGAHIAHEFLKSEPVDDDEDVIATMPLADILDRVAEHNRQQERDAWR